MPLFNYDDAVLNNYKLQTYSIYTPSSSSVI